MPAFNFRMQRDYKDIARGMTDNSGSHASHHKPLQSCSAMGPNDYHIDLILCCIINDVLKRLFRSERGMTDNSGSHASHHKPLQSCSAMGPNDYHIDLILCCIINDVLKRLF